MKNLTEFKSKNLIDIAKRDRIVVILAMLLFVIGICLLIQGYLSVKSISKNVYVIDNEGKAIRLTMEEGDITQNRIFEAKAFVKHVLELFFTISPDETQINYNIQKLSFLMGDESVQSKIDGFKENMYYTNFIALRMSQNTFVKEVLVEDKANGIFQVLASGRNIISRPSAVDTQTYTVECFLRSVPRSENNAHGFLIERFQIIDIKTLPKNGK